jgi:anti-anti-sigma regulatory factor
MASGKKSTRRSSAAPAVDAVGLTADNARPLEAPSVDPAGLAESRPSVLQLGPSLSIREVGDCAVQLKGLLAKGPIDVDVSRLESIDTAGIQLLLAAAAAAQRRGFKLKLLGAQGLKTGAARSLGLAEHLGELAEILP